MLNQFNSVKTLFSSVMTMLLSIHYVVTMVASLTMAVRVLHSDINVFLPNHVRKIMQPEFVEQPVQFVSQLLDAQLQQEPPRAARPARALDPTQ